MRAALLLILLVIPLALPAAGKKPVGEIRDARELARVQTYCVDTRELSGSDRYLVQGFLKVESKPKHLLSKLPWKLLADCPGREADAIATIEFVPLKLVELQLGQVTPEQVQGGDQFPYRVKATLTVLGNSSQALLYTAQALPLDPSEGRDGSGESNPVLLKRDALYHVSGALIEDLRRTSNHEK